jgi:hypothetical protein
MLHEATDPLAGTATGCLCAGLHANEVVMSMLGIPTMSERFGSNHERSGLMR